MRGGIDHRFEGPFDRDAVAAIATVVGGHHLDLGIKGDLAGLGLLGEELVTGHTGFAPGDEKRYLGGITDGGDVAVVTLEVGAIAQHTDSKQPAQRIVVMGRYLVPVALELALGFESLSGHGDVSIGQGDEGDGHLVLGECTGLVGENDGGRSQGLDRGEALDQGVALRHTPHTTGERDGRHDGEALGDAGYGQCDGGLDHEAQVTACQDAGQDDRRTDSQGGPHEAPAQAIEPLLEGGGLLLGFFDQGGDVAQLGVHASGDHDALAGATRHGGAFEQHAGSPGDLDVLRSGFDLLADRDGLAGKR